MSGNALYLTSRRVDQAVLVASSQKPSLPVTYLQDRQPEKKFRTEGCATEWITLDLGAPYACNMAAFVGGNGTSALTMRVRGAASPGDVTASPGTDSTVLSAWPASGRPADEDWPVYANRVRWTNAAAYRYWRIDLADAANPDGYLEFGRLFLAPAFQPAFNVDQTPGIGLVSADQRKRTPLNKTFTDRRGTPLRRLVLPISAVNEDDLWDGLFDMQRLLGTSGDFFFSLYPDATTHYHRYALQASFADGAQYDLEPFWDSESQLWRTSLTLEEFT